MSTRRFRLAIVALALLVVAPGPAAPTVSAAPAVDAARGELYAQRRPRPKTTKKKKAKASQEPAAEPAAEPTAEPAAEPAKPEPAPAEPAAAPAPPAPASPAPTAAESTTPEVASSAELVDVDALRQEYLQLRDELFASRARAATVSSQLYSTRITIRFSFASGRHYGVRKASVRLDGATVFEDDEGKVAADDAVRFEGYVAPGRHVLTFRIEAAGKDDDRFTSAQEVEVALQAVAGKDLVVTARAKDGGDIAYQWKRGEKGSYGLGIDIAVKAQKRAEAKGSGMTSGKAPGTGPASTTQVASAGGATP
jgi:hypothetical protein